MIVYITFDYFFILLMEWRKVLSIRKLQETNRSKIEKSDADKNIKKGIEIYEEKVMSGETPAADASRSDE